MSSFVIDDILSWLGKCQKRTRIITLHDQDERRRASVFSLQKREPEKERSKSVARVDGVKTWTVARVEFLRRIIRDG